MAKRHNKPRRLVARRDQPLIGILREDNGREFVEYTVEDDADDSSTSQALQAALAVIGAWSDLDWDEMDAALDRIRHQSVPTPPFEP